MIHGNVRHALVEVRHRITPSLKDVLHHAVGFRDRPLRVIDKASLDLAPALLIPGLVGGRERPDRKLRNASLACFQIRFRFPNVSGRLDRALVFRPEAPAQEIRAATAQPNPGHRGDGENDHDRADQNDCSLIHGNLLWTICRAQKKGALEVGSCKPDAGPQRRATARSTTRELAPQGIAARRHAGAFAGSCGNTPLLFVVRLRIRTLPIRNPPRRRIPSLWGNPNRRGPRARSSRGRVEVLELFWSRGEQGRSPQRGAENV